MRGELALCFQSCFSGSHGANAMVEMGSTSWVMRSFVRVLRWCRVRACPTGDIRPMMDGVERVRSVGLEADAWRRLTRAGCSGARRINVLDYFHLHR